ncbi:MAG: hypothetical protein ACYTG6_08000 [Planctomycetota bacterium]
MLENDKFIKWANENILVVVGHTQADHEFEEVESEEGESVKQCLLYPGLTCDQHEAMARDPRSESGDLPTIEHKSGVPNSWLVSPTGEVREIDPQDQQQYKAIIELVEAWQDELGNHLTLSKYEKYRELLAEGDAAIEAADWKAALKAYAKVERDARKLTEALLANLTARIEQLDAAIRESMEAIRDSGEDVAEQLKAARALDRQIAVRLKSGYLPVREDLAAFIKELKAQQD